MLKKSKITTRIVSCTAAAACMFSILGAFPSDDDIAFAAGTMTAFEITENMQIGWNIGNTLDAPDGETAWFNPQVTQELIDTVKAKGFNTIRIPTTWYKHVDGNFNIDEAWLARVKEVVDYCYKNDMYVILNIHHEEWINRSDFGSAYDEMSEKLKKLWLQIADYFSDYDQHLIFEGMNEPRAVGQSYEWYGSVPAAEIENINKLNADFVNTVRSVESPYKDTRLLMIPPYCASNDATRYSQLEIPDDDFIAVSIHAYSPYDFTMNTAVASHDTFTEAYANDLENILTGIRNAFIDKDIPVIIGEFGASNFENTDARCEWAKAYITTAKKYGMPCVLWDNNTISNPSDAGECHGYVDRSNNTWYSVSEPVIDSMMSVINDTSIKWGSEKKIPTYTHEDIESGKVLYKDAAGQTLDSALSGTGGNCSSNYSITPADLEGKDIAVKFTGDAPAAAFMDGNWKNWTEVNPYEVDEANGIAYVSGESVVKAWTADTDFAWLCFRTNGKTNITAISLIKAAEIKEIPDDPKFEVQTYDIEVAENALAFTAELNGTPNAYANGCLGYMDGEDWISLEWETTLDGNGSGTVMIDVNIPKDVTSAQFQIWWAGVETELAEIKMTTYNFFIGGVPEIIYGDANDNGDVEVADAVFILQGLADPSNEEFKRTSQGEINADCHNAGNGVDSEDALAILKFKAMLIESLPTNAQ